MLKDDPMAGKKIIGIETHIVDVEDRYLTENNAGNEDHTEDEEQKKRYQQYREVTDMLESGELYQMVSSGILTVINKKNTLENGGRKKIYECIIHEASLELSVSVFKTDNNSNKTVCSLIYKEGNISREIKLKEYKCLYKFFDKYSQEPGKVVKQDTDAVREKARRVRVSKDACIVKSNNFLCEKYHNVEDVVAVFTVVNKEGELVEVEQPAGYCHECGLFYIKYEDFNAVLKVGVLLCKVIRENIQGGQGNNPYGFALSDHSPLSDAGYTVKQSVGLTAEQRHAILENLVDNSILSKQGIVSYLDTFIFRGANKHNMRMAVEKWEEDKKYIKRYKIGSNRRMHVDTIINNYVRYI